MNNNGNTAFMIAVQEGNLEVVKELIKANAEVNAAEYDGLDSTHDSSAKWASGDSPRTY